MTKEIIKFSIVGLINFTIEYTVFFIIYRIIKINYIFAVFNAYSIMILSSYFLNKKWTFKSKFKSKSKNKYQILKYIIIYISVLILRILMIKIIIKKNKFNSRNIKHYFNDSRIYYYFF